MRSKVETQGDFATIHDQKEHHVKYAVFSQA